MGIEMGPHAVRGFYRELKQTTTATATRTSPDKRINEPNNSIS